MDYAEKLESITVGQFIQTFLDGTKHAYGPTSINRRVTAFLGRTYAADVTLWYVVLDGPRVWRMSTGVGSKVIEALANAINIELGANVVDVSIPTKKLRSEGYFWTVKRLEQANALLDEGQSRNAVAKLYGKSSDGLKAALRRYGMEKTRTKNQWQSIDTAPQNGTLFLAYMGKDNMEIARFDLERNEWWIDAYAPPHIEKNWMEAWMPLPAPPKQ